MPWATAKVKGVVIAETDFPQVIGGDVYVCTAAEFHLGVKN